MAVDSSRRANRAKSKVVDAVLSRKTLQDFKFKMSFRVILIFCCLLETFGSPVGDRPNKRIDHFRWLLERKIEENRARNGNVHGHIVSVNEAHEEERRGNGDKIAIEEEIVASNEDPRRRPGCELVEGDLCLDPEDEAVVNQARDEVELKRNVMKNTDKLWPNKVIYYYIDPSLKHLRNKISEAVKSFHDRTCLTFREVDRTYDGDFIKMYRGNGCWSKMGRSGGRQSLSLGSGCEYVGVVMHELMHSVGIWHEQSRPDRDQFVEVMWSNIEKGQEKNFMKYNHGKLDTLGLAYDYDSVMHYDRYLYSVQPGKKPTIIARGRPWKSLGGQLGGTFTQNDINELNALYDC